MKSQTISRKHLSEIYGQVCEAWQKKIAQLIITQHDTNDIVVPEELIKQAYSAANADQKKIIEKYFNISFGRPNTLDKLAITLGISRKDLFLFSEDTEDKHERFLNACNIIPKFAKFYNDGVILNWKDTNQYKYAPYYNFVAGRVAVGSCYFLIFSVGFYFKDNETAQAAYDDFPQIWKDYWGI
jgi:hypothetical protein